MGGPVLEQPLSVDADGTASSAPAGGGEKAAKFVRVKRLERPDRKGVEDKVTEINTTITGHLARLSEIRSTIDTEKSNKQAGSGEMQESKNRVQEALIEYKKQLTVKKAIREELSAADEGRERAKAEAKAAKDKLPYVRLEDIDEEVKKLEYRLAHTTLSLGEEKKIIQQIQQLSKSREFVKGYTDRVAKLSEDDSMRAEILERLRKQDEVLAHLDAEVKAAKQAQDKLWESRNSRAANIPALIEERAAIQEQIGQLREQIKELWAEFNNQQSEFYAREKEWHDQQRVIRKKEYDLRQAEREERARRKKEWEKENFVEPFTDELIKCDQLISFLQKLAPSENEAAQSSPAAAAKVEVPAGVSILVSKKDRGDGELEGLWGGLGGSKKGKKGKSPAAEKKAKAPEKLSLSLDVINSFAKVKVPAPTSREDVVKTLTLMKEKKLEFVALQEADRKKREAAEAAEAAGAVAAAPADPAPEAAASEAEATADAENGEGDSGEKAEEVAPDAPAEAEEAAAAEETELTEGDKEEEPEEKSES